MNTENPNNIDNEKKTDTTCNVGETGYWQDIHEKAQDMETLKSEFSEAEFSSMSIEKSRRNFLKIMGFSVSALPLASCVRVPVKKALPYLKKNDTVVPGVANWFATKYEGCESGCQLLVKTREGRPIKIEGNALSKHSKGGACSVCQGSVMELYDGSRLKSPLSKGANISWTSFDQEFLASLNKAQELGEEIVLVTKSLKSPSTLSLINDFKKKFNKTSHIAYDAVSKSGIVGAALKSYGVAAVPELNFLNADVVVSFGADFLSSWGDSTAFTKQYSKRRNLVDNKEMLKHVQLEPNMSLTGSNADERLSVTDSDMSQILLGVYGALGGKGSFSLSAENKTIVSKLVKLLLNHKSRSIIISSSNDIDTQVIINKINQMLGNDGETFSVRKTEFTKYAIDADFYNLLTDISSEKRKVQTMIFWDVNPSYDYFNQDALKGALSKVKTKVSFQTTLDETGVASDLVAASNHSYESWNDHYVNNQELALTQPVMDGLYGTRMAAETLLAAIGNKSSFYEYIKAFWKTNFFSKQKQYLTATTFWNHALHDGVAFLENLGSLIPMNSASAEDSVSRLKVIKNSGLQVVLYTKQALGDGRLANNPWLQELPDPITKATWDNYIQVSPVYAKKNSLKTGDLVSLTLGSKKITLPALVQAGTKENTIAVALGYGRSIIGKVGKDVGGNAYPFVSFKNGTFCYSNAGGSLAKVVGADPYKLALTQTHHSMEGRDIVRETTLDKFLDNPKSGNENHAHIVTMWSKHEHKGHKWGMVMDLNQCTGCSGCIVSCNAENNVPVVGKEEVHNRREMHWLRIDRYYKGDDENPEVVHQPMTCQHCDNAPCESVCPVLATVQSSDGLNQQVYNRCVGTRYCANNCPYKVRRFNWFDYPHEEANENMVLNPDVVVRSRGVMEKCSMCVQRIQAGKLEAKKDGRVLVDTDIKMACEQSCPADAITFGDMNNPESKISKLLKNSRNYKVLEELNIQPAVSYLTKVRNK